MHRIPATAAALLFLAPAVPAFAQDAPPSDPALTVSGSVASYVDTDISGRDAAYLQPSLSKGQDGYGSIADGAVLVPLAAAF